MAVQKKKNIKSAAVQKKKNISEDLFGIWKLLLSALLVDFVNDMWTTEKGLNLLWVYAMVTELRVDLYSANITTTKFAADISVMLC